MLLSGAQLPLANAGAERLRANTEVLPFDIGGVTLRVTLSAGLAEHRPDETIRQTLERADAALYRAKAQGRNRVVVA